MKIKEPSSYDEVGTAYACMNGSCLTVTWYPAMRRALLVGKGVQINLWLHQ